MEDKDHDLLITLAERVEQILRELESIKTEMFSSVKDHGERITKLEISRTRQSVAIGIYITIGAILSSLMFYHIIK